MHIPLKYLTSNLFTLFIALFVFSSYLVGTSARIIFVNVFLSLRKKKVTNTTVKAETKKFIINDVIDPKVFANVPKLIMFMDAQVSEYTKNH